jgi:hypothetical protein
VAKAIEAEAARREADHNDGAMYPSWGENLPGGATAQGRLNSTSACSIVMRHPNVESRDQPRSPPECWVRHRA